MLESIMDRSITWWIVQFSITFLEFVILYVLTHAILKRKIAVSFKHIIWALLYVAIVAPLYLVDTYVLRIVALSLGLFIIWLISKRGLGDLAVIYTLIITIGIIIQVPISAIAWVSYEFIDFYLPLVFLTGQLLTTVAVIFVSKKFKLSQWFHALQINHVLRLIVFILALLLLIVLFILNFNYQLTYFLFFTMAIVFVLIVLYPILLKLYHNSIGIISVHDLHNSLLSATIAATRTNDPDEIRKLLYNLSKEYGINPSQLDDKIIQNDMDQSQANKENIETFIKKKLNDYKKDIEIISEIDYSKAHDDVDFSLALKWLGTLLDNALEASEKTPIYIDIFSIQDEFSLEVANEYVGESKDIQLIFERGYTTKGTGRGIGLHNLYTQVTELGGVVEADTFYTEVHNCHYLHIKILFKYDPYKELLKKQKDGRTY